MSCTPELTPVTVNIGPYSMPYAGPYSEVCAGTYSDQTPELTLGRVGRTPGTYSEHTPELALSEAYFRQIT